jgi:arsenite methyltransferase
MHMSSTLSAVSDRAVAMPAWLESVLGVRLPGEGDTVEIAGMRYVMRGGIPRAVADESAAQAQTRDSFSFIWSGKDRFQSDDSLAALGDWYRSMYGDVAGATWWDEYGPSPLLVDAGCGAGLSAVGLFGERLRRVRYLGVDVSTAVEQAALRFGARGYQPAFVQTSLMQAPLADGSVDVIFSQGVLHHTDSTEAALKALARKLRPGGRFLFYVYRRKGPIREFTDDHVRAKLREMTPQQAWSAMMPLTKLGKLLGDLKIEIDVPEAIDLLEIPAGRIDLQRLFYWHVFKAFHHERWSLDELNHINLDWYAPANAHRQTPEQVRAWCAEAGLVVEREHLQDSGITIIARRDPCAA